jgi:hypothetical protein
MEIIAVVLFFAVAVWYLYRRLIGAWKVEQPSCGCGCDSCPAAPKPDAEEKRSHEENA